MDDRQRRIRWGVALLAAAAVAGALWASSGNAPAVPVRASGPDVLRQATATPTPAATPAPTATPAPVEPTILDVLDHLGRGRDTNRVELYNRKDGRFRLKASIDLNRIEGDTVAPQNVAVAVGSCSDCQTFAIALQLDITTRNASTVTPLNVGFALNYLCSRCYTVARAVQYVIPVDDPNVGTKEADDLFSSMERELREIGKLADRDQITLTEAESRINAVIDRFRALAQGMLDERREAID